MTDALEQIKATMGLQATGYAVSIDGVLRIITAAETKRNAALFALQLVGVGIVGCTNDECDCAVKALAEVAPNAKIVPVGMSVLS